MSMLGILIGVFSLISGYFYYIHSTKPTATEIATELRQSLNTQTNDYLLRTNHHVSNVVDIKVTNNGDWLDRRDDANEQWGHVILKGIFVGSVEIIKHFDIPQSLPSAEEFRQHPYYGQTMTFEGTYAGTGGFEVSTSHGTLTLNIDIYADSTRKGAASAITTTIIVSQIIDDILSGRLKEPEKIPTFDEFMSEGLSREDIDYPIIDMANLKETDFSFPNYKEEASDGTSPNTGTE